VSANLSAQSNGRRTVGVHQLDPRFTFGVEKYWSGLADSEEYFYYVKNNTSEEYKIVIEVTLTLNCVGTKTYKLGWNKEIYLKPYGMFSPKDDAYHNYTISSDREKQKACLIAEGDTHTLFRGLTWTLSNIVNITAEKQAAEKKKQQDAEIARQQQMAAQKKQQEEQARQQQIAAQKKQQEEQARQQQIAAQKKQQDAQAANTRSQNIGNQNTGGGVGTVKSSSNINNNTNSYGNTTSVPGSSALSEKVSVNGADVQVYQQNGQYYMVGSNGQPHVTTKIAYDKVTSISNTKRANAAAAAGTATATTTTTTSGVPENTSGNNPLANYNPGLYNTTKTEAIVSTAVSVLGFIGTQMEENRQKRERERQAEMERSAAAARLRAEKESAKLKREQLIANRKAFFATYPVSKTPLSSQEGDQGNVYFFGYSYQQKDLENDVPQVHVSNIFSIAKYSDGTWPQKAGLTENVSRAVKINSVVLSGFYLSSADAETQQQAFFRKSDQLGFKINMIDYTAKKTEESISNTDFWGNPINSVAKTPAKKAEEAPVSKAPEKKTVKEVELDFWGNPIKK